MVDTHLRVWIRSDNDQGNPAAAKDLRFQNPPDPPLGLTVLFGVSYDEQRFR
jgi:hypothetical protein